MAMTKAELIDAVQVAGDFATKADAKCAVEAVFEAVEAALVNGEEVRVPGFGTFKTKERAARQGRNPQTGASLKIPARTVVSFKPAAALKESVN